VQFILPSSTSFLICSHSPLPHVIRRLSLPFLTPHRITRQIMVTLHLTIIGNPSATILVIEMGRDKRMGRCLHPFFQHGVGLELQTKYGKLKIVSVEHLGGSYQGANRAIFPSRLYNNLCAGAVVPTPLYKAVSRSFSAHSFIPFDRISPSTSSNLVEISISLLDLVVSLLSSSIVASLVSQYRVNFLPLLTRFERSLSS
jgi:hypothetical protein